jgi:predicted DNA-binding protein
MAKSEGQRLSVWLDKLMREDLEQLAKAQDRSVAYVVRKAVEKYIQESRPRRDRKQK